MKWIKDLINVVKYKRQRNTWRNKYYTSQDELVESLKNGNNLAKENLRLMSEKEEFKNKIKELKKELADEKSK